MATGIAYGWQVENSSGTPVSGAKIYFKIKGTSTNATTYTDSALTVPAANPVVADAAGWFATYISPTVNYDIQIKSADDSITYQSTSVSPSTTGSQPLDATLTALAGAGFESRHFLRGTGVDTVANVTLSEAQQVYYVEDYGAVGDGSTDDRVAIQAAIDAATAAGGGTVWITQGKTYRVSNSGSALGGIDYAIRLKEGVYLDGGGTIARHGTAMNFTIIAGFGTVAFPDVTAQMGLRNITVDGKSDTRVDGAANTPANSDGFNVWLYRLRNPVCENVVSINSANMGFRIESCAGGSYINNLTTRHGPDANADCVHFIDCRNISGHGFELYSEGDDGFVIEAKDFDVYNLNFTGIVSRVVESAVTDAMRAIVLLKDVDINTTTRQMYDCHVQGTAYGDADAALYIRAQTLEMRGCTFDVTANAPKKGLVIEVGDATYTGVVESCRFNIVATDCTEQGVQVFKGAAGGTLDMNEINAIIYNPGDGFAGVQLLSNGTRWSGSIVVNYDPAGTKASLQNGISLTVSDSSLFCQSRDALNNIALNAGSVRNTIYLGSIEGGSTTDLVIAATAENNTFIGGRLPGTVTNSGGSTNLFNGVQGVADSIVFPNPISWTPTISSATGSITTASATVAVYRKINRTIFFSITISVTDNGTGATSLRFTPPTTPAQGGNCTARNGSTGVGLIGTWAASGANISIQTTAGAYPIASGQTVTCAGWYFDT